MPTTRPRHTITETPPLQEELDRLRVEAGSPKLDFAELVMLGAREKRRQLARDSEAVREARERLARYILDGTYDPGEVAAADEVKTLGLVANYE
jgi:hypothetical protein